jgi:hypothetical protein
MTTTPTTLYGIARQAGPLPACTRLYRKPDCRDASWERTEGHVCAEGEIITDSFGQPLFRVTYAQANCAGTQAVMDAIEASAKTGRAA